MDQNHWFEKFKHLSSVTQVALVILALVLVLLLVAFPASGTSIITFLAALKMLTDSARTNP